MKRNARTQRMHNFVHFREAQWFQVENHQKCLYSLPYASEHSSFKTCLYVNCTQMKFVNNIYARTALWPIYSYISLCFLKGDQHLYLVLLYYVIVSSPVARRYTDSFTNIKKEQYGTFFLNALDPKFSMTYCTK